MKTAFVYIDAGKGHYIPAKALSDAYLDLNMGESRLVNLFDIYASKKQKIFIEDGWRMALKFPRLERFLFPLIDNSLNRFMLEKVLDNKKHMKHFREFVEKEQIDLFISTNFITGLSLAFAIEKIGKNIPVFQYAADAVSTQRIGVTNKLKMMYLASPVGTAEAIKRGMEKDKVKLCPFPLQYKMENAVKRSKKEERIDLGLDEDGFIIAFSLGGEGITRLSVLKEVDKKGLDVTFILLGRMRKKTEKELKQILKETKHIKVITPGFVDNIHQYFLSSDITMGKAGANSVMESIYLKRYTIISDQLYPFENIKPTLENNKIGCVENNAKKQADIIEYFYFNREELDKGNYSGLGITFSAKECISLMIEDYRKMTLAKN